MSSRASIRASTLGAIALGIALAGFAACSDDDGAGSGQQDAGAAGAAGAAAGASGGTGASSGSSGAGATSGAGGDGGQWGSYPVWEPIPGGALDCKFERLMNAAAVTVFKWQPCPGDVGCEQALLNPTLAGSDFSISLVSRVQDDGASVRVGLHFNLPTNLVVVADRDGAGLDGFRPASLETQCRLSGAAIWEGRLATLIAPTDASHRAGGILVNIGDGAPTFFEAPQPMPPGVPAPHVLGETRWLWWWAPKNSLTSVSTTDGSGFASFAMASGADLAFNGATTTGTLFLFNRLFTEDSGVVGRYIAFSDGVAAPEPYLIAPAGSHFGYPAYAHSHVAFMRGINPLDLNLYEALELWASPFNTEPQALQPEFVGPLTSQSMSELAGGWGYVAKHELLPPNDQHGVQIWNLETKTKKVHPVPEGQIGVGGLLGMTRTHFWLGTAIKGKSGLRHLLRYPVR